MIDYEIYCKIKQLHEQDGLKATQIGAKLAMDARTVRKWIDADRFRQRCSSNRTGKLDPFKPDIVRLLEHHPYSATQIYQKISENGFDGKYTIVKEYVRKIRPPRTQAYLSLVFAPGECAQVDWGSYGTVNVGGTRRRLSFFVMVLCYSRLMYVEFTVSEKMEHFLGCHQRAFEFIGMVPKEIMVDNLKSAVLRRHVGQEPVFNPKYKDFADYYGFKIKPCAPGKGNEKGRVENGVGYVKKNFLAGLDIPNFEAIHPAARNWQDGIANVRIHATTREQPILRFEKERTLLTPLPPNPYDIAKIKTVRASSQFRVVVDTNKYSVPAEYAGQRLILKRYPDRLCIYHGEKLIARHIRSYDRYQDIENPDHPRELIAQRKKARDQKIFMRFLMLSNKAEDYYRKLSEHRMNPTHHVRKIVALSEIYDPAAVARAMDDAFEFQAFSSEYIANILEQRSRFTPEPQALHLTRRHDLLELTLEQPDISIYEKEVSQ
jgi:transposase